MRKTRILIFILIISLFLMEAGYAQWTENIAVNNTVKVGELSGTFTEASIIPDDYIEVTQPDLYENSNVNSILCEVSNFYPGGGATLNTVFKNDGTIPSKITSITIQSDGNEAVPSGYTNLNDLSKFTVKSGEFIVDKYGTENDLYIDLKDKSLNELEKFLNENIKANSMVLEPSKGNEPEIVKFSNFHFILNNNDETSEKSICRFTININLGQN
jgi:hypothetical protein